MGSNKDEVELYFISVHIVFVNSFYFR